MSRVQRLIAQNTKAARRRKGWSQADLAEHCGMSASFVGDVERARKYPSALALERLATALGLEPYHLLLDEGEWEIRDRIDSLTSMHRDLKTRLNAELDEALRRHAK